MYAVGIVTAEKSATGHPTIKLLVNGKWHTWVLANDMPINEHNIGLFRFEPEDQFCYWVDASAVAKLFDAVDHVLFATEDGGNLDDIDFPLLRTAIAEAKG